MIDSADPFVKPGTGGKAAKGRLYLNDLRIYLQQMKERVPGNFHPSIEMFDSLWENESRDPPSMVNHLAAAKAAPSSPPESASGSSAIAAEFLEQFKAM